MDRISGEIGKLNRRGKYDQTKAHETLKAQQWMQQRTWLAAFGATIGIGAVAALSSSMEYNFLLAPFGATSIIAFLTYDSDFARPKNILGGYIVTSVIGVGVAVLLGHSWWTYALGVGLAMLAKVLLRVVHPPSAAMPILLIHANESNLMEFVVESVFPGLLLLVMIAVVYNRYILRNGYPIWN